MGIAGMPMGESAGSGPTPRAYLTFANPLSFSLTRMLTSRLPFVFFTDTGGIVKRVVYRCKTNHGLALGKCRHEPHRQDRYSKDDAWPRTELAVRSRGQTHAVCSHETVEPPLFSESRWESPHSPADG